ncbi:hypothetical protein HK097_006982, partial [Rhizophlyctis rosea]
TYQVISLKHLGEVLNMEDGEVRKWAESVGWAVEKSEDVGGQGGDVVKVPVGKENSAKPQVVAESIRFEQLTKIIGYGRVNV